MVQVIGSLPCTRETEIEFLAPNPFQLQSLSTFRGANQQVGVHCLKTEGGRERSTHLAEMFFSLNISHGFLSQLQSETFKVLSPDWHHSLLKKPISQPICFHCQMLFSRLPTRRPSPLNAEGSCAADLPTPFSPGSFPHKLPGHSTKLHLQTHRQGRPFPQKSRTLGQTGNVQDSDVNHVSHAFD